MQYTLRYSSSRLEVMRLYARTWRARLWKMHALLLLGATLGIGTLLSEGRGGVAPWVIGAGAGLLCIASLAAWPLAAFKSQDRLLVVDRAGLRTTIGDRTGTLAWLDVDAIEPADGCVHIQRSNLNAFIVPRRAFASDDELDAFLRDARAWLLAGR